jgi:Flp pilus assembly protein TadG
MTTPGTPTLRGTDEGAVLVEAAIALPILLFLMLGVIQFSVAIWQANTMLQAVTHFGRYAIVHAATCDTSCIQTKVQTLVPNATVPLPTVTCTANTNWMTVTASHNVNIVTIPGLSLGTWSFSYRVPIGPC